MSDRVAIVIPWFGPDCKGGAESLAAELATRLSRRYEIDVLTTCAHSFLTDWARNVHPPGDTTAEGYRIRRFPVDQRAKHDFETINGMLLSFDATRLRHEVARFPLKLQRQFITENINSSALVRYISAQRETYRRFIFLPYLYGTTVAGVEAAGARAVLQPCLHDEVYAYLRPVEAMIRAVPMLFFNSDGEFELARRMYGPGIDHKSVVVGSGIEFGRHGGVMPPLPAVLRSGRFALYLGRRDRTKGVDFLLSAFRRAGIDDFQLVLAGPGTSRYGDGNGVIDLGFVDDGLRERLLRDAAFLAQPSLNESFSRVMMEAWSHERPVLAQARCLATATAVSRAGGGVLADGEDGWMRALADLATMPEERRNAMGRAGHAYAIRNADWTAVVDRYAHALADNPDTPPVTDRSFAIHQVLETLEYGDAISNHALAIRDHLRSSGYDSDVLVANVGELVLDEARVFSDEIIGGAHALIYHHSIGTDLTERVVASSLPTMMIYHNITPARFFRRLRPELALRLDEGRVHLKELRYAFTVNAADSAFNGCELEALGYPNVHVLPIVADYRRFDVIPARETISRIADGVRNILFVGRYVPNKALDDLIRVFALLHRIEPETRLILAGRYDGNELYFDELRRLTATLGVSECVVFTGLISDADLLAYYLCADVFLSLSEHEGFCVPLVEAMAFGIPIVAYDSSAISETLGGAGILVSDKTDHDAVAGLVRVVLNDEALRAELIQRQLARARDFTGADTLQVLDKLVASLMKVAR